MLKVENVVKYYGKICAVDNLSFEVKEGEIPICPLCKSTGDKLERTAAERDGHQGQRAH